jgi:hypothetical protein
MAFGFHGWPDFFDFAVGANEEGAADDALVRPAHKLFFLPGAEGPDGMVIGIAEQGEIQFLLGFERRLGFDRIGA